MNLLPDKWSLLREAENYRSLLRLLSFALIVDCLLAVATGANLLTMRWAVVGDRPGLWVMALLAYGVVVRVIVPFLSAVAMSVLEGVITPIQRWLSVVPERYVPDPLRFVSAEDAQQWLRGETEVARRAPVEKQLEDQRQDRKDWALLVEAGWVGIALVIAAFWVPGSCIAWISEWHSWTPWAVLLIPALPCAYHAWVGAPGHDQIELPELAMQRYQERVRTMGEGVRSGHAP